MKKNNVKSILSLAMISFLFIAFAPNDIYAQQRAPARKVKKQKVVTPVRSNSNQLRRGAQVTVLPKKSVAIAHRNTKYHYQNGIFYRPNNGRYIVTTPPIGIRITVLPPNPYRVVVPGRRSPYYYSYGTYYAPVSGGYEVVDAPIGARVDALPDGYEEVQLDHMVYYRFDNIYYKAVVEPNGYVAYEVVRV